MGSAYGRLWGEIIRDAFGPHINPGVYALVGAASMLSGVTRITITLSVILFETTNEVYLITPIMLTVLIAKWIADRFNISLYDIHIALKCLPFVEPDPPLALQGLTAREIMASPCVTLQAAGPVHACVDVLRACGHNGFAVVDEHGRWGARVTHAQRTHCQTTRSHSQTTRARTHTHTHARAPVECATALEWGPPGGTSCAISPRRATRGDAHSEHRASYGSRARAIARGTDTARTVSARHTRGPQSSRSRTHAPLSLSLLSLLLSLLLALRSPLPPPLHCPPPPPLTTSPLRFCGCILRNWVAVLLKHKKWSLPGAAQASRAEQLDEKTLLMPADFDAETSLQSKQKSISHLEIDAPAGAILDLRPYINPASVTVTELCPVARCFALFRALGIRHMPVLSLEHKVGIITGLQPLSSTISRVSLISPSRVTDVSLLRLSGSSHATR